MQQTEYKLEDVVKDQLNELNLMRTITNDMARNIKSIKNLLEFIVLLIILAAVFQLFGGCLA